MLGTLKCSTSCCRQRLGKREAETVSSMHRHARCTSFLAIGHAAAGTLSTQNKLRHWPQACEDRCATCSASIGRNVRRACECTYSRSVSAAPQARCRRRVRQSQRLYRSWSQRLSASRKPNVAVGMTMEDERKRGVYFASCCRSLGSSV